MRAVRGGSWALVGLLLAAPTAWADDVAGQITASTGSIEGGEQGAVSDGEHVNLGDDGGCSILVDQDSLVELCGDTSLVLRKEKQRRVVALDRGEIKLMVEPRTFDKRVEIHTPAVVATLLGTIVHVSVDEDGVTTISSAQHKISVRSRNPDVRGTTVIDTSEQIVVAPGEAPPAHPRRLERSQVAALGGCLVDFHSAAIGRDVDAHSLEVTERLAALDATDFDPGKPSKEAESGLLGYVLPKRIRDALALSKPVQSPQPTGLSGLRDVIEEDPITAQEGICTTTDCVDDLLELDPNLGSVDPYDPRQQL